jgi:hypothetical protein
MSPESPESADAGCHESAESAASADWHTRVSLKNLDKPDDRIGPQQAGASQRMRQANTTTTAPTGTPQPEHLLLQQVSVHRATYPATSQNCFMASFTCRPVMFKP